MAFKLRIFAPLYNKAIAWSAHKNATYYLTGLSIAESSFFPIPPDVMLATMTLAKPKKAWYYALLTTLGSVFGGILGYLIGAFGFNIIKPLLIKFGYMGDFQQVVSWFQTWGFWVVCLAGFSPIPYKVFTISAGVLHMQFLPFILASVLSRGARFFLVSSIFHFGGERLHHSLQKYVEYLGWLFILLSVLIYIYW